jgi:hypothetical protein
MNVRGVTDDAGSGRDGGNGGAGGRGGAGGTTAARDAGDDAFGFDEFGVDGDPPDAAGTDAGDAVPEGWRCAPEQRGDGVCDCGCGRDDPDCEREGCAEPGCGVAACALCHDAIGRELPCPGHWTCSRARFGDALTCDCGCGHADPDCGADGCVEPGCEADGCDLRWSDGAPIRPGGWSCEAERFGTDGVCDCGCGQDDPDCAGDLGCSAAGCYADGCGKCFGEDGSELSCERGACTAGFENDGVCDCGCRRDDPDCLAVRDCVEPGCSADGCGRCHNASGEVLTCAHWSCELERQGGGDGCACGCGAADPDCGAGQGCALPGCAAQACDTCRSEDGAPMSCPQ